MNNPKYQPSLQKSIAVGVILKNSFVVNRIIASFLFSFIFSFVHAQNSHKQTSKQPNILFIMADDLTMTDIEPYGSTQVHTPNMTRLAKEGLCLDNMFNLIPVCAPTRQSLLTGLGPVRNGAHPNHSEIYEGIKTLPTYLQTLGYNTALIGKRHYGPEASFPFDFLGGRQHDDGKGQDIDLSKAADSKYQTIKTELKSKMEAFMKQQGDKGVETEMQALTRQPKNRAED